MAFRALHSRLPATGARKITTSIKAHHHPRFFSREAISRPSNLVQVYISRSTDPYLNLSIEHYLLQKSHPESVILFLYTNRPCIVIGRNQNPWVEVNLNLLNQPGILAKLRHDAGQEEEEGEEESSKYDDDPVLLVRRRSGGGTVFHDFGNVNYSVICPPASFDRNKHAEMVVRALRRRGRFARVNERHDIVQLDIQNTNRNHSTAGGEETGMDEEEEAEEGAEGAEESEYKMKAFKISGSAYKLTRLRSLHHGTCLLSSPHLPFLGQLLRSPAAPYIKARGVESVRSPVRNVGIENAEFESAVVDEFRAMYVRDGINVETEIVDEAAVKHIPEIRKGTKELSSRDWIYAQTPQFVFSSHPTAGDPRPRPDLPTDLPPSFFLSAADEEAPPGLQMTVRHAEITDVLAPENSELQGSLKGLHFHRVTDWRAHVGESNESVGRWLNRLLGLSEPKGP
ncbi:hypothetical protein GGS20DRAFT_537142 [Poronia punctata]|nr:hypothetical protein GGS20DRAFT_537142 [Poronia punctata]